MSIAGRQVGIIGAGVAGLAVAVALAQKGAQVTILEQADALREVGAGLQVSPNGLAVLRAMGLEAALAAASIRSQAVRLIDGPSGALLFRLDLMRQGAEQGFHILHRADLIELLRRAALGAGVQIRLLHRAREIDLSGARPRALFEAGEAVEPWLLIGADGLRSEVRAALNGAAAPHFTGQIAWRAILPAGAGALPEAEVHMAPGRHLVSYPLRGGTLRNIVAVEERARWAEESWSLRDDPMEMRLAFRHFSPRVQGWLSKIEDVWLWGLFRHPVAREWGRALPEGGVAILGDAAHPTLPFLAQGANMALEDAWVLADSLMQEPHLPAALHRYQARRSARAARIVAAADGNARIYHAMGLRRLVQQAALRGIAHLAPASPLRRLDWLYRADVTRPGAD